MRLRVVWGQPACPPRRTDSSMKTTPESSAPTGKSSSPCTYPVQVRPDWSFARDQASDRASLRPHPGEQLDGAPSGADPAQTRSDGYAGRFSAQSRHHVALFTSTSSMEFE